MDFSDALRRWLDQRTPSNLEALFDAIQSDTTYRDLCEAERTAAPLLAQGRFDEARAAVSAWMPGAWFSPSTHLLLAIAHRGAGDEEAAAREERWADIGMHLIRSSGDGSSGRPFDVLRINDSWDLVASRGEEVVQQSSEFFGGQLVDRLVTSGGSELWFRLRNNGFRQAAA